MTLNVQIRDEKRQYDFNRKAAEISALPSSKLISMNILLVRKYYHLVKN